MTRTGRKFYPFDPRPEDVEFRDVANALSNICRFTGHTAYFYSVAEHSCHVSQLVGPEAAVYGLLHDAAEAYIGDISRPVKKSLYLPRPDRLGPHVVYEGVDDIEDRVLRAVVEGLGLPWPGDEVWDQVRRADDVMLRTEACDIALFPNGSHMTHCGDYGTAKIRIRPWTPDYADQQFSTRFRQLMGREGK